MENKDLFMLSERSVITIIKTNYVLYQRSIAWEIKRLA